MHLYVICKVARNATFKQTDENDELVFAHMTENLQSWTDMVLQRTKEMQSTILQNRVPLFSVSLLHYCLGLVLLILATRCALTLHAT